MKHFLRIKNDAKKSPEYRLKKNLAPFKIFHSSQVLYVNYI